MLFIMTYWINE